MRPPARPAALIMLICALLATLLPLGVRPAAAQGVGEVSVQLTNIPPETLGTSGDLTIRGTVTNSTDTDLRQVRVSLWRDATPLLTLAWRSSRPSQG